jgi:L-histidine N-alpha-methyltransferase
VGTDGAAPVTVRYLSDPVDHAEELARDAREGLLGTPKTMPSKWFYDARGSQLFDDITRLPEYYLTRAETEILERCAGEIVAAVRPREIVELGSGYSVKTKLLIDAMRRCGSGSRYVPIDISEDALREAGRHLSTYYPWLAVDAFVADYLNDLDKIPRRGTRLVTFLGSTLGNYPRRERRRLLGALASSLSTGDGVLIGLDLVKPRRELLAAYDDAAGVTAEFNRNLLHVLNRELDGDFPVDEFVYEAAWNEGDSCIDMGLRASRATTVTLKKIDLEVHFAAGELLHNEVSCKFTRRGAEAELMDAGLLLDAWHTDERGRFALALARPVELARS